MRLTHILRVYFPKKKTVGGLKFSGKNQIVLPVKTSMKEAAVNRMLQDEQNLQLLNNPYLTAREEEIYGQDHPKVRLQKKEARIDRLRTQKKPFFPNRTLEDHFKDLNLNKKWE